MSSSILPQSEDRSRRVEARNKMIVALRKSAESLDEILKGRNRWKKAEEISALIGGGLTVASSYYLSGSTEIKVSAWTALGFGVLSTGLQIKRIGQRHKILKVIKDLEEVIKKDNETGNGLPSEILERFRKNVQLLAEISWAPLISRESLTSIMIRLGASSLGVSSQLLVNAPALAASKNDIAGWVGSATLALGLGIVVINSWDNIFGETDTHLPGELRELANTLGDPQTDV